MLTLFLFASSFIVIYAIANHFSLMYSIVLIEIISFIFIGVATKERGEKSIKSIMTKESVVAYLIPSLFSYILGLISLALSGGLSGTLSTPISALTHGYPIFGLYAPTIFMSVSLIIKMGIFPFFVYALNVNKGISWGGIIFIGVVAKIPIVILMLYYGNTIGPNIITFCGVLSLVIASMAAFTTPHAKKFMACSSLAAMGWLTAGIGCFKGYNVELAQMKPQWTLIIWAFYIIYSINTILLITILNYAHPVFFSSYRGEVGEHEGELNSQVTVWLKRIGILTLFTQMGIPPLAFFWTKLIILVGIVKSGKIVIAVVLLVFNIVMVCFYFWMLWNMVRKKKGRNTKIGVPMKSEIGSMSYLAHQNFMPSNLRLNGVMILSSFLVCIITGIVAWV